MAFVVGSVLLTVFSVPAMMVFFACSWNRKNFRDGIARSRRILKGKMAMGCAAFSSAKPVYYIGTCSFVWSSHGDRSSF